MIYRRLTETQSFAWSNKFVLFSQMCYFFCNLKSTASELDSHT